MLVSVLALGGSASAADPPVPLYLNGGSSPGGEFAIFSNDDWRVEQKRIVEPHVVVVASKGRPSLTSPFDRQDRAVIWAPACLAGPQVVSFIRDVRLPGKPSEIGFAWTAYNQRALFPASAQLYVNGELLYTKKSDVRVERDKTHKHLDAWKSVGANHIELIVPKRAIPAGSPRQCNTGAPRFNTGVSFVIDGKFATDVATRTDVPATEVRHTGYLVPVNGAIDIVNNGPSTVYWGQFEFVISGPVKRTLFTRGPTVTGPGVTGCKSNTALNTFASPIIIECRLRNMRAGTKAVMGFGLIVEIGPEGYESLRYSREVRSSADDPNPRNNTHTNTILLCTETATNPACAG